MPKRGTICIYCGESQMFDPMLDDIPALYAAAIAHDKVCPRNPLVADAELGRAVRWFYSLDAVPASFLIAVGKQHSDAVCLDRNKPARAPVHKEPYWTLILDAYRAAQEGKDHG